MKFVSMFDKKTTTETEEGSAKHARLTASPSWEEVTDTISDKVPVGSIDEVKDWVGDDTARAIAALTAENAADDTRVTLTDWLATQMPASE